jgi:uncharacterized protein DUF222/HNH endonuclease
MELTALTEAIDELIAAGPSACGNGEMLCALQHQQSRLDAYATQAANEFDTWGEWANDGAKNASTWLSSHFHEPVKVSRRRVARGRGLKHLPIVAEAFADGTINSNHLDALLAVRNPQTEEAMARDEELLVEQATTMSFQDFSRQVAYWEQSADPDGVEEDAAAQRERRDAYLGACVGGMHMGKMTLDPISGAIVGGEWDRLEHELFQADWAESKERLGHEPTVDDLSRTPAQRRVDALVEMATRSRTAPADGRRPAPLISVFVGYETLHGRMCQLSNGTVVTPGSLLPWLEEAYIERAVFQPGARVEVSETSRLFKGATRRAIELRDRQCSDPSCDEPLSRCEVDHIEMASQGGPTTQENGRLLCGYHNRLRNQRPPPDD